MSQPEVGTRNSPNSSGTTHPGSTAKELAATCDAWVNHCTPATFPGRILLMSMVNEISWWVMKAQQVSDNSPQFRPGFWANIAPGSELTWKYHMLKPGSALEGKWDIIATKMTDAFGYPLFHAETIFCTGTRNTVTGRTSVHFSVGDTNNMTLTKLMISCNKQCVFLATANIFARGVRHPFPP